MATIDKTKSHTYDFLSKKGWKIFKIYYKR